VLHPCPGPHDPGSRRGGRASPRAGLHAIRVQVGLPGLPEVYGTGDNTLTNNAAADALPREEVWSTPDKYLRIVPRLFSAVRDAVGEEVHLLHDTHHRLTPIEAARLGRDLEPFRLFWLEDVVPAEDQSALRLMRHHTVTPLAIGEVFNTIWDCQGPDRRAADRLYPHDRGACRRADGDAADH
jgi:mannonate dehydratase